MAASAMRAVLPDLGMVSRSNVACKAVTLWSMYSSADFCASSLLDSNCGNLVEIGMVFATRGRGGRFTYL